MTIANRLDSYLSEHNIPFQTLSHSHSSSSIGSAMAAHVPPEQVAKAVLLGDHEGRKIMAVLPASYKISISALNEALHGQYHFLKEDEFHALFRDCEFGAIPPVGEAYNMTLICDQTLDVLEDVYFEAGDHETLIRVNKDTFKMMTASGKHIRFSHQVIH